MSHTARGGDTGSKEQRAADAAPERVLGVILQGDHGRFWGVSKGVLGGARCEPRARCGSSVLAVKSGQHLVSQDALDRHRVRGFASRRLVTTRISSSVNSVSN